MAELSLQQLAAAGLVQRGLGDARGRGGGVRHDSPPCAPGGLFVALAGAQSGGAGFGGGGRGGRGDLFVAVAGAQSDGAEFVADAVRRGAVAVLAERELEPLPAVPLAISDNALLALARIAQRLYEDPTRGLQVVGVTGTNG